MKAKGETVIIGAGPAGMAASMELFRKGLPFYLIDKDKRVGGLAKTYKFGEFRTDNGPHRFYSKNKYLYEFLGDILGKDWIIVKRYTRQFIDGKFYDYPINALQAFKNIGFINSSKMLFDYLIACLHFRILRKKIENFEDYIVANFGRSLGEFNMLNYTEKQYGMKCNELHSEWAKQRIKGISFREAVSDAIKNSLALKSTNRPKSLIDEFYYPLYGSGDVYEKIYKKIRKRNIILLKTFPTRIKHNKNQIKEVLLNTGKKIPVNKLITSIPIDEFVKSLTPTAPIKVLKSLNKLKFRSQVYLFITLNRKSVSKDQWIYLPNKEVPLFRISEMKNFSSKMSPKNKTSLFVEFFCWEGDEMWNMTKKELFNLTVNWLEKFNFIKRGEVLKYYHIKSTKAYPVYDLKYKENLKVVTDYLDKFNNLIYIGRPGRFRYTNQDHSLEMGILAARSVIENRKINVEDVGSENEYFEKGYVKA